MSKTRDAAPRCAHCDGRGIVIDVSPAFAEWLAVDAAEIVGTPISRWYPIEIDARLITSTAPARERREIDRSRGLDNQNGERRTRVVEERYPRVDDDGAICGLTLVVRDDPGDGDAAARLASVIAAAPDVILLFNREGRTLEVISEGGNGPLFGADEIIGRRVRDVVPEIADAVEATLLKAIETGGVQELEYEIKAASGARHFSARAVAVSRATDFAGGGAKASTTPSNDDSPVIWVTRDITHRRRADETRRLFEKQLAETQKLESLKVLAGGIAHDFNNLLVSILANANYARTQITNRDGVDSLRDIEAAASRAADLCRQLLAYTGGTRLVPGPVALNGLMREVTASIADGLGPGVELRLELDDAVAMIECDRGHIRHVVRDLITNSAEAIDAGSGGVGIITVSTGTREVGSDELSRSRADNLIAEGRYAVIEVSDSGCGMPEELVERVCEPFFSTKFRGRGLGLAAAVGIMRAHQGAFVLESEPGSGSSVRLYLPERPRARRPLTDPATRPSGGRAVLLVDDDELIRNVARRILESVEYSVITARDGSEGVERYRSHGHAIDCVIMDLTMPVLDGSEAARRIRSLDSSVPLILSSGYAEHEYSGLVSGDERTWFLQKPYRANELVYAVRRALAATAS